MEEAPRTTGKSRGDRSDPQEMKSLEKLQVKGVKRGKRRRWDLAVTAAEFAKENQKARQGRKDESIRGWMKNIKRVMDTGVKKWRPGMKVLREFRFYQKSTVLLTPMKAFLQTSERDWSEF